MKRPFVIVGVRRLKGGTSFIHFAIEGEKERIQELSVHLRQTLERQR